MKKYKKPMVMSIYRYGVSILYKCYRITLGYGKKCK